MFPFFQKSIFDPNTCTLPNSPNNGFRWCPLGKLSHLGLEQLIYYIKQIHTINSCLLAIDTYSYTIRQTCIFIKYKVVCDAPYSGNLFMIKYVIIHALCYGLIGFITVVILRRAINLVEILMHKNVLMWKMFSSYHVA